MDTMNECIRQNMRQILDSGLSSVMPSVLIKKKIRYQESNLIVNDQIYPLRKNVYMIGFGKAVAGMSHVIADFLKSKLNKGIILIPDFNDDEKLKLNPDVARDMTKFQEIREQELKQRLQILNKKSIEYLRGAKNNQPDEASYANTKKVIELVKSLGDTDTLITLISGGGSSLLFAPKLPIKIEEKQNLCKRLQNSGANINELNVVRKQLSSVKGGALAELAYPAQVLSLVLSDVIGDPLDIIASGPTCLELSSTSGNDKS